MKNICNDEELEALLQHWLESGRSHLKFHYLRRSNKRFDLPFKFEIKEDTLYGLYCRLDYDIDNIQMFIPLDNNLGLREVLLKITAIKEGLECALRTLKEGNHG